MAVREQAGGLHPGGCRGGGWTGTRRDRAVPQGTQAGSQRRLQGPRGGACTGEALNWSDLSVNDVTAVSDFLQHSSILFSPLHFFVAYLFGLVTVERTDTGSNAHERGLEIPNPLVL